MAIRLTEKLDAPTSIRSFCSSAVTTPIAVVFVADSEIRGNACSVAIFPFPFFSILSLFISVFFGEVFRGVVREWKMVEGV